MSDVTKPDKIIKHNAHRELVFEGYASEKENLSLMIEDATVDGIDQGYYKIPLYTAQPQATVNGEADIELVHIFPLLFDSQAQDDNYTSVPTSGYIYIYVDGYLWRELQVEPLGDTSSVFSDVNLAFQKGYLPWKTNRNNEYKTQGRRDSTGERLKTIIVPNKLKGQQTCVEIAYSEVQWSWTQILKLGGINPKDPRLNVSPPLSTKQSQSPDTVKAQAARAARMQVIDNLSDFENGYSQTGLIKQNDKAHKKLPHPDSEDIAKVVLNNGLFFVRQHINKIHQLQIEIELMLMASKGEEPGTKNNKVIIDPQKFARFELAEKMINRLYQMNDAILDGDIKVTGDKNANKLQKEQMEYAEKVKGWRGSCLNEDTLKSELQYDDLLETAEKIKNEQLALVQLIENDVELVSFKSCMKDFTLHPNATFADGLDVIRSEEHTSELQSRL